MSIFTDRIDLLCQEKRTTVSHVLTELGMSHTTAVAWKKNGTLPNSKTLDRLARFFNVNSDWLRGEVDERSFYGEENLVGIDKALLVALWELTPQQVALVKAYIQGLTT